MFCRYFSLYSLYASFYIVESILVSRFPFIMAGAAKRSSSRNTKAKSGGKSRSRTSDNKSKSKKAAGRSSARTKREVKQVSCSCETPWSSSQC